MDLVPAYNSNYSLQCYFYKISIKSHIIYWLIIILVTTSLTLLPFIYIDVSVQARGYIQSDIEKQIISSPYQGRVIYTKITNGSFVQKGDTLMVIDSETMKALLDGIKQRDFDNQAAIDDLKRLTMLDSDNFELKKIWLRTSRYQAEYTSLTNQYSALLKKYLKRKSEHERNLVLYKQEIIPASEFENSEYLMFSEKENVQQLVLHQKSIWQSDLSFRIEEDLKLKAEKERCNEELADRIVLSPANGEIIQSSDLQVGSIISSGQRIAEISPDGILVATCFIRPSDIGFVHENGDVKLQIDAYNYHEWGVLRGKIFDISDDIILENGSTAYFRVKCKPDSYSMSLRNGTTAAIKKGMTFTSRILVTRRSLFQLLFDKADKWFNPYTFKRDT
jgi:membrane fusion protein, peptide pheromone/bacteriocin exporter